jgi:FO synthase
MEAAAVRRDYAHGRIISFSPKVFIPLTKLCRDLCGYCDFRQSLPRRARAFLSRDEALAIAREGLNASCHEALITLGDKPEIRYPRARTELAAMGHTSTIGYVAEIAEAILQETGLLPHINPGLMTTTELIQLRRVSLSQGIMLETIADRLGRNGGAHFRAPDKRPALRLNAIRAAGEAKVPFTTGILIGIGETREERIDALFALRDLNDVYGHIQEIIIQNFLPKPDTRMANHPRIPLKEHLWTIAIARLIFEPEMNVQAPPNLQPRSLPQLIAAGINDWGGVSPVTPDHVNLEAPWPTLAKLRKKTATAGYHLMPRLPLYPRYVRALERWAVPVMHTPVLRKTDADGWLRTDTWVAGKNFTIPKDIGAAVNAPPTVSHSDLSPILKRCAAGHSPNESDLVRLFQAHGQELAEVFQAANELCQEKNSNISSYVVNCNINYTNICSFRCAFCAFAKGNTDKHLRGEPFELDEEAIATRVRDAWERGATEICMQGGIHPSYTGETYLSLLKLVRQVAPDIHIHAFSPLEVSCGAETLSLSLQDYLTALKEAGLNSLPGTAAEILDDELRATFCPDKISSGRWLDIMRAAHGSGLSSTASIMFGHIDRYEHWARHLLHIRRLQSETGGFTEFVPLPFIHMETPLYSKGRARRGPTFREVLLMHAVARIALNPVVSNIQVSWVKLGLNGTRICLKAGANDMGGTLMCEAITRAAGASHGEQMSPQKFAEIAISAGRTPRQRTTSYGEPSPERLVAQRRGFESKA